MSPREETEAFHSAQCNEANNHGAAPGVRPLPKIPEHGDRAVDIKDLTFSYDTARAKKDVLHGLNLQLKTGSRCLLIGANGAGKSTLLKIIAGRHLTKPDDNVMILGMNAFRDTKLNFHRAYLDMEWGMRLVPFAGGNVPLMADIAVKDMMKKLQESYPTRRDELVDMLGIDLNWRMHQLSDGQRRRVQIMIGLVRPYKVLLLDEITTSLDVCVRQDLLRWLIHETETRDVTVLYATHIFDGLEEWPTHLYYLTDQGKCGWQGSLQENDYYQQLLKENHPAKMLAVADRWLRAEMNAKRVLKQSEKAAGALAHALDPQDRQGGYASGRGLARAIDSENKEKLSAMEVDAPPAKREGRLADLMGPLGRIS
jgi:CCR4-NOT complex subunit CAF16